MERAQISKIGEDYTQDTVLNFGYGGTLTQVLFHILEKEGLPKRDIFSVFAVKGRYHGEVSKEVPLHEYSFDARSFRISNPELEIYLGREDLSCGHERPKLWGYVRFF